MKQNKQKSTKKAQVSFWQQEVSFDLKKSPVLNFFKQDVDMDINNSPIVKFLNKEINTDLKQSPVLNFLKQDIDMNVNNSPVVQFLNKEIETDLTKSPVLNFCKQEVTLGGFADVSASPILNWFKPVKVKTRTAKITTDEVVVKAIDKDFVISCLIVSILMNMFMLISWLYYQVDPASRQAIVQMIFG